MLRAVRLTSSCAAALVVAPTLAAAQQVVDLPRRDRDIEPRLESVFNVGSMEGREWEMFGERVEVAFDGAGNLHVFDPSNDRVVVIDPQGRHVRTFGKAGEGPGELRSPASFGVFRDGTTIIGDMAHRSFLVYSPAGEYLRSVPFAGDEGMVVLGRLLPDPRGGAVVSAGQTSIQIRRGPGSAPAAPPPGHPITRFELDEDGGKRLLHTAWQPTREESRPREISGGGMRMQFRAGMAELAFEPQLFAGALPDGGIAFSDSSAYAVKILGADGRVQRILRRPIEPREVTSRIQAAEKERRLEALESGEGPRMNVVVAGGGGAAPRAVPQEQVKEMMRQRLEELQFYSEVPVVTGLATGWSGKIWVARRGRGVYDPGPIDVLSPTGEYLGSTLAGGPRIPAAFGPEGLVAYVERNDLDVVTVQVKRLPAELR